MRTCSARSSTPSSAAKGCSSGSGALGRQIELGARLARIRIDPEKQDVGREPSEVDDAVVDRLGRIGNLASSSSSSSSIVAAIGESCDGGAKMMSIVFVDVVLDGSSDTTQACPTRA